MHALLAFHCCQNASNRHIYKLLCKFSQSKTQHQFKILCLCICYFMYWCSGYFLQPYNWNIVI